MWIRSVQRALVLAALAVSLPAVAAFPDTTDGKKAVLVTGASTGIGRLTAETLAAAGHLVYAGARKPEDLKALNAIENVEAVRLDVTRQADIDAAVELIGSRELGLWGLVNNAGINRIDPLIEVDMDALNLLFDVNVFGVVRVTKAFAPLLIDAGGRVAVVSSISGILAGYPAYGGYAMTKHAMEAYIDTLAVELGMLGVTVSGIEPGNYRSQIGMTRCELIVEKSRSYKYYNEVMASHFDYCADRVKTRAESTAPEPTPVAEAIMHSMFDDSPKQHYLVTSDPFESEIVMRKLFERVHQFSMGNNPPYSRDELLELYDDEGKIARGEKQRPRYD